MRYHGQRHFSRGRSTWEPFERGGEHRYDLDFRPDFEFHRDRRRPRRAFDAARPERRERGRWRERAREEWRDRWDRLREKDRERGWTERGREFLRKYRQPLVGLTMLGAAAPVAKEVQEAEAARAPEAAAEEAARGRLAPGRLEEQLGERWAATRAEQSRENLVRSAMQTYGIPRDLAEDIHDYALRNDLEPQLGYGLVKTESGFDHRAVSNVGARGLTQVMPRTARWLRPGTTAEDLYNRQLNLDMGFGYLRDLIDKYNGNVRNALLAYNRGPGTVDRVLRQGGDPNNGYADKVMEGYEDLG